MGKHGVGIMAQWLRARCVLTEDSGSVPRTTSGVRLYLHLQEIEHPLWPPQAPAHTWCTYAQPGTHTHTNSEN